MKQEAIVVIDTLVTPLADLQKVPRFIKSLEAKSQFLL